MTDKSYASPLGGLPPQTSLISGRSIFTNAYTVIPQGVMTDIVCSNLPHWTNARFWVLSRPMTGFSETFSHYIGEVQPGGGSLDPEPDETAQAALFVSYGELQITIDEEKHTLSAGSFAYLPSGANWTLKNTSGSGARFHWIRKRYEAVKGINKPDAFVANEMNITPISMPDADDRWKTTRFMNHDDIAHDMHITIVTLEPGASIPFLETHVMEHGLYVLQGRGIYNLNQDWVEVEAGDYMWLRAFCPQACYAVGSEPFRYLLYKDVNRHAKLGF